MSSTEILINVTPQETRVAFVEAGMLQEVAIERTRSRGIVGNVYMGKVCRVLPGMEAAFVEIGLDRAAFLHASDVIPATREERAELDQPLPINSLLQEGQKLLVQVVKDPLGTKGARLTTHVTIPSRYLVLMPYGGSIGVSTRIEDNAERERLRQLVQDQRGEKSQGYILRTAAEGVPDEDLIHDMAFL
ncbi:MAG TPA: Rne/Rng family ribonuclease, partial [Gammaproteobacteria bacterium]|nr:Rne/Rng family ribonuclease [Gammaproteobacteria bacterium]